MNERDELLRLLARDGIFRSTAEAPILTQDGTPAAWMLDSLRVTMTARGAQLAAACLLRELAKFDATQIATLGLTAIPLMQACIALGDGRYTGVLVRKEPKGYGTGKLVEGPLDRTKPVVILDDSISSGTSLARCIEKLEAIGVRVEGCLTLVRFGFSSGWARGLAHGLRMATVFDVYEDIVPLADVERVQLRENPSHRLPPFTPSDEAFPDGLHPAVLARHVMERFYAGAPILRAPARLDAEYDARGGCWVSVRSRANVQERFARNGFWVLPGEDRPSAAEATIKAALRTTQLMTREQLDRGAVGVTHFGALERCTVGELDNDRYGILVRGTERPEMWGGALPSMPGIFREWAQFEHARTKNCKLFAFEPYELYRHDVTKAVEPGSPWQPDGVRRASAPSWHAHAPAIAARAFELAREITSGVPATGAPMTNETLEGVLAIYFSVYRDGHVIACVGDRVGADLDTTLQQIARYLTKDSRFAARPPERSLAVVVSFLDHPIHWPDLAPAAVAPHVDPRRHALVVQQGTRQAILLPFARMMYSLAPTQFVIELVDKAGITRPPYNWTRVESSSWCCDGETTTYLPWSLPPAQAPASIAAAVEQLLPRQLEYLRVHQRADGTRDAFYRALLDRTHGELERGRQLHGAWTLAAAHRVLGGDELRARATASIEVFTSARDLEINEAAMLLLALVEHAPTHALVGPLSARLASAIDDFGTITRAELPPLPAIDPASAPTDPAKLRELELVRRLQQLDYVLPQVALALARAPGADLDAARRACRRAALRFASLPAWAQVCWLPQAAAALYRAAPAPELARDAFAVIDWALPYQHAGSGGFLNAEQPDSPGCTTVIYLEGIAAGIELAIAVGDRDREARYRAASLAALRFVDELTYQERDRVFLPAPARAYGGLRFSRTAGDVRTDFVQHAVHALLRLRSLV